MTTGVHPFDTNLLSESQLWAFATAPGRQWARKTGRVLELPSKARVYQVFCMSGIAQACSATRIGTLSAQALSALSMIPTWMCRRLKRKQCSSRYDAMWRFDGRR